MTPAKTPTQDIEFNSTPALDLANAETTKEIINLRIKYGDDRPELYKHLEARDDTDLQKFRDSVRNTHLESTRQYSQTAYRFGDYVAKYCLVPSSETQKKLYEETVKPGEHERDILSNWLKNFHEAHDAEYLLQFQLLGKPRGSASGIRGQGVGPGEIPMADCREASCA